MAAKSPNRPSLPHGTNICLSPLVLSYRKIIRMAAKSFAGAVGGVRGVGHCGIDLRALSVRAVLCRSAAQMDRQRKNGAGEASHVLRRVPGLRCEHGALK
ncbi:hypothetical protein KCP75_21950 [Salmonella enterica subsp. enterica]|nr:hypothetical protein KCP75_21950 [Salmonella enterica subsp. enterica]